MAHEWRLEERFVFYTISKIPYFKHRAAPPLSEICERKATFSELTIHCYSSVANRQVRYRSQSCILASEAASQREEGSNLEIDTTSGTWRLGASSC